MEDKDPSSEFPPFKGGWKYRRGNEWLPDGSFKVKKLEEGPNPCKDITVVDSSGKRDVSGKYVPGGPNDFNRGRQVKDSSLRFSTLQITLQNTTLQHK